MTGPLLFMVKCMVYAFHKKKKHTGTYKPTTRHSILAIKKLGEVDALIAFIVLLLVSSKANQAIRLYSF